MPPTPRKTYATALYHSAQLHHVKLMDDQVLKNTINQILSRNSIELSPEEREHLLSATNHPTALKLLAGDAFNRGSSKDAVYFATKAYQGFPNAETEENLISCLVQARQIKAAIDLCRKSSTRLTPMRQASLLSELFARSGSLDQSRIWGLKALGLKDKAAGTLDKLPALKLKTFDPNKPERNVISFSLFGKDPKYAQGAIRNAMIARHLYPDWTVRFYVDEFTPVEVTKALGREGAQLRRVGGLPAERFGTFWRFLVEDDPSVDFYLVRDCDSILNIKERAAVDQWLSSKKAFHVMRDGPSQSELILAGMWGAHRGNIGKMTNRIMAFDKTVANIRNSRILDQQFLREVVWPVMRGRLCVHDSIFGYGKTHEFDPDFSLMRGSHIGDDMTGLIPTEAASRS